MPTTTLTLNITNNPRSDSRVINVKYKRPISEGDATINYKVFDGTTTSQTFTTEVLAGDVGYWATKILWNNDIMVVDAVWVNQGTYLLYDTFTDENGVNISTHISEIGEGYYIDDNSSNVNYYNDVGSPWYGIYDNSIQHNIVDGGSSFIITNTVDLPSTNFFVEFDIRFNEVPLSQSTSSDSTFFFGQLSSYITHVDSNNTTNEYLNYWDSFVELYSEANISANYIDVNFAFGFFYSLMSDIVPGDVRDTIYRFRIEFMNGNQINYKVNDILAYTETYQGAGYFMNNQFAIRLREFGNYRSSQLDNLRIGLIGTIFTSNLSLMQDVNVRLFQPMIYGNNTIDTLTLSLATPNIPGESAATYGHSKINLDWLRMGYFPDITIYNGETTDLPPIVLNFENLPTRAEYRIIKLNYTRNAVVPNIIRIAHASKVYQDIPIMSTGATPFVTNQAYLNLKLYWDGTTLTVADSHLAQDTP